jgi:hypothetical protein
MTQKSLFGCDLLKRTLPPGPDQGRRYSQDEDDDDDDDYDDDDDDDDERTITLFLPENPFRPARLSCLVWR